MRVYRVTRLFRPIDIRLRSNQVGVFGPLVAAAAQVGWTYFREGDWDLFGGVLVAIACFLAWAIGRELDPDHPMTASIALALAFAAAFTAWEPALLISAASLVGLRALVGTVGGDLKPLDLVVMTGIAAFCGTRVEGWVVVLLLVLAVLDGRPRGYSFVTVGMLLVATAAGYLSDVEFPNIPVLDEEMLWALITVAAIALSIRRTTVRSTTDLYGHPILWPKVRAARVMAGFVVIGGIIGSDADSMVLLSPVLAGLLATALVRTFRVG